MNEYTGPLPDYVRSVLESAQQVINQGGNVYFKFTCAQCGARQTFDEPNSFYTNGKCEECEHITNLLTGAASVNFLAIYGRDPNAM